MKKTLYGLSQKAKKDFKMVAGVFGRFFERPKRRWPASVGASIFASGAGLAGASGVFLGSGETLVQKAGNAVMAIPNMLSNLRHYLHLPEYIKKANLTAEYLREQGPAIADSLSYVGRKLEAGASLAQKGLVELSEGFDNIMPGGNFDPIEGYNLLKSASNSLKVAKESIKDGGEQLQETAQPVVDALKEVDLNPVMNSLYNLADNVAPDEIVQTLGIAAACVLTGYASSQYIRGYWGRRGRPGIVSRFIQKRGLRRFKDYYARHPDKIAGEGGLEAFKQHLIQNPEKLEELVKRAGMKS